MSSSEVNLEDYVIPLMEIKNATDNFSRQRRIGGGGFGTVYRAKPSQSWQNREAAVKRLNHDSQQGKPEFRNELDIISRLDHRNIISFIGYCEEDNEMIIVYEYAENESLDHHLQYASKMGHITWTQRLMICIGAAEGLCYLHSRLRHHSVIHKDIKSSNILLDENLTAKIGDFGLSRLRPKNGSDTQGYTTVGGTMGYVDPAFTESRVLQKTSDVYSFGVVLFEIMSGMLAYREQSIRNRKKQILMAYVRYYENNPRELIDPKIRDQVNNSSFDTFQELAYQCITLKRKDRPNMYKVVKRLQKALDIQNRGHQCLITRLGRSLITSFLHTPISANPDAAENHLPADGMEEARLEDDDSFNFVHVLHWIIHIVFVIIFLIIFYK